MLAEINHFSYGLITPALSYVVAVLGSLLGLICTLHARNAPTTARRVGFLLLAAWGIGGTGIWVMHFIAMMGFGIRGAEIRYDVPITFGSAVIAVAVVAIGLLLVALGRRHPVKILLAGLFTGVGVASMHYTGMLAMRFHGEIGYDPRLVVASVAIAVVAATAALWFTVTVRRAAWLVVCALVMGIAVSGMHYTGMAAMRVHLHGVGGPTGGSPVFGLLVPIMLLVILAVVGLLYAVLAAPTAEDHAGAAYLDSRITNRPASALRGAVPPGSVAGPDGSARRATINDGNHRGRPPGQPFPRTDARRH